MNRGWRDNIWMRPAFFVAVNLFGAIAFFALVAAPIDALLTSREAQIAERRAVLARLNAVAARAPEIQDVAKRLSVTPEPDEFLKGPNEGVIAADLQTRLKALVQPTGARLRSVRSLSPRTQGEIKYVGAQLEVSAPIQSIQQTIHAIENARPHLFVVSAVLRQTSQPGLLASSAIASVEPYIDAQLDVFGPIQPEGRE